MDEIRFANNFLSYCLGPPTYIWLEPCNSPIGLSHFLSRISQMLLTRPSRLTPRYLMVDLESIVQLLTLFCGLLTTVPLLESALSSTLWFNWIFMICHPMLGCHFNSYTISIAYEKYVHPFSFLLKMTSYIMIHRNGPRTLNSMININFNFYMNIQFRFAYAYFTPYSGNNAKSFNF